MSEFKKCKVIMLPTKDITDIVKENITNKIKLSSLNNPLRWINQHLYITSDEKIEEGWKGWAYKDDVKGKIFKHFYTTNPWYKDARKIVETTDKSLKNGVCGNCKQGTCYDKYLECESLLPQIPQSFIKQYVESGGKIEEVEIEIKLSIEKNGVQRLSDEGVQPEDLPNCVFENKIKTDSNNCIIVKPIKESWTREEVEELCRTALHTRFPGNMCMQEDADKWIANYIK